MMESWTIKVLNFGKTQYGLWALVNLCNGTILYYGIVQFKDEYKLEKDKVYDVKTIDIKQLKNNKLQIKIGL